MKRVKKKTGGEAGIRTLETIAGLLVFETSPIDHSGTSPSLVSLFSCLSCMKHAAAPEIAKLS